MGAFSGILGTGWVEDWKMMKDKLLDGKKLWVGLESRWLKMLVVNMMNIQFHLKLGRFYCIGAMN